MEASFVANKQLADQLAEVGVILLMFGVGLHFHLKDLIAGARCGDWCHMPEHGRDRAWRVDSEALRLGLVSPALSLGLPSRLIKTI